MSLVDRVSSFLIRVLIIVYSFKFISYTAVWAQLHLQQLYKECPDKCSCYNRMTTVDCREGGLYSVPLLPNTSTHLYLQANRLHQLSHYAFHFAPEIHVLNLRENLLTVMDTYAFAGLQQLEHIDLRENRIAFVKLSPLLDSILYRLKGRYRSLIMLYTLLLTELLHNDITDHCVFSFPSSMWIYCEIPCVYAIHPIIIHQHYSWYIFLLFRYRFKW